MRLNCILGLFQALPEAGHEVCGLMLEANVCLLCGVCTHEETNQGGTNVVGPWASARSRNWGLGSSMGRVYSLFSRRSLHT